MVRLHKELLRALALWARRRTDVPAGATALPYATAGRGIMIAFLVLSAVEVAAVEFLVPWLWLRVLLLLLAVWSMVLLAGVMVANAVFPHTLTATELRLRNGLWGGVTLPLDALAGAGRSLRDGGKAVQVVDGVLSLTPVDSTNVEVRLARPVDVAVGKHSGQVRAARLWCDDPAAAAAAINAAL